MLILLHVICLLIASSQATDLSCSVKLSASEHSSEVYKNVLKWKEPHVKPSGDGVELECPTGFISEDVPKKAEKFTCKNGKYNGIYELSDLLCRSDYHANVNVRKISKSDLGSNILHCNAQGWIVYEVSRADKKLYRVCFDTNTMRPKFSYRLKSAEKPVNHHVTREDVWGFDGFGKTAAERKRLSEAYVKRIQERRITQAFHDRFTHGKTYPYYFNRGHLTAYTDLTDADDQKATVEYINAAPQWDELNKHSWSLVEREVRSLLEKTPENWEIYTGTYGQMASPRGPLFLSPVFDKDGRFLRGHVPVPMLFWKIAHNIADRNQSRVFIGVNNPDFKQPNDITPIYRLCRLPLRQQGKLVLGDEFKGFTYECPLDEFLIKLDGEEKIVVNKN